MRMKNLLASVLCLALAVTLLSCAEPKKDLMAAANTIGEKYQAGFKMSEKETCGEIVDELIDSKLSNFDLVRMDVEEGYLNGFSTEVTGFKSAAMFSPMIGAIPFVGYVFECDDPNSFLMKYASSLDKNWNICTCADELITDTNGKFAFVIMCPSSDE